MANSYDDSNGVWRTIGGRRVFIRTGQSLSDAMKESGKFKKKKEKELEELNKQADEYAKTDLKDEETSPRYLEKELSERIEDETHKSALEQDYAHASKQELEKSLIATEEEYSELSKKMQDDDYYYKPEDDRKLKNLRAEADYLRAKLDVDTQEKYNNLMKEKRTKELEKLNKQADEYATTGLLKDKELQKAVGEDLKKSFENVKDGKYYRNRLLELDKEDTPTGTYDIETGEAVDFKGKGYSVSFEQTGVKLTDQQYIAKINECRDRCDGNVYFGKFGGTPEVSFHTDDINEAMKIMKENNQYSIYDIANDTEIVNDEYDASTNKIKDLSQTKANETKVEVPGFKDYEYDTKTGEVKVKDYDKKLKEMTTNDTMNNAIRTKASKKSTFKDDLPKHTEIKTQGTSNRKEVSENIQAHILEYYDSPEDFIEQMDAFDNMPTKWHAGQEMAKQGFYDIYYEDQRKFLNDLKINPNGKEFSDDKVFQTYTSLIGRESAKLYDRLQKNAYNKYKQSHPLTRMTLEEFIKSRKEK